MPESPISAAPPAAQAENAFVQSCLDGAPARLRLAEHQLDFLPGGKVLVVTFEPARIGTTDLDRPAWGQGYLQRRGHSLLGVKRVAIDWYRQADLHRVFRSLQRQGWFERFEKVVFYGPSMGGYAALAFAECAPGCTVIALNPQSTLEPGRVWFDQRFAGAGAAQWQGDFVDGIEGARLANRVYVCYDPYHIKDRLHAERLPVHNRVNLRLPFGGHTTAQVLNGLGLLGTIFDQALAGTLDEAGFRRMASARAHSAEYHANMAERGMWMPRRMRHLEKALQIDPKHPRALMFHRSWTGQPPAPAPVPGDGPPPLPGPGFRWPAGLVTAPRVPLVYVDLQQGGVGAAVQNHLLYLAAGAYPEQPQGADDHPGLLRSREDDAATHDLITRQLREAAYVFTFVRDPGRRAHAFFNERILRGGPGRFGDLRRLLTSEWGVRLPGPGEPDSLERHRENFAAYLRFVEASLAGRTSVPREPAWAPQIPAIKQLRKLLKVSQVCKVENFASDLAWVLHRAEVRRTPDLVRRAWSEPPAAFEFETVLTPALQAQLDRLYESDYTYLGYRGAP